MQIITVSVFALFFSAVNALSLSVRQQGAPQCALTCLTTTPTGNCGATNDTCLCTDETFLEAQFKCVQTACTDSQQFQAAQAFAVTLCEEVGVNLNTDTNLIPAPTTAAGGSNSSSTNSSNSAAPSPTAPPSSGNTTTTQTGGALSLNFHAAGALLLTVAGIALTL